MTIDFSEESMFVARNWETVAEIVEASQRLRSEMGRMLASLEDDLKSRPWWCDGWVVVMQDSGQICVSRQAWKTGENYLVRMGVDRFRPTSVFGLEDPPYLYIYVWGRKYDLRNDLLATLDEETSLGEIGPGGNNLIVAQQAVAKCLPEGVKGYFPQAREQMLAFFDHYGSGAAAWDPIVQRYVCE